ncbi:hypothetical protein KXV37_002040 [Aspergillus fumigatus]|nr:hypothetical protein KXX18_007007 [Aspergillus fumigatus]KAH2219729.1 hypothetical protein KXV37_002040 [Aspergillus fumigatus]KAH2826795.1 hypothetical protein KXW76_000932 [Aspergillus fumigatus]KAH2905546.1 hypothetical protein KXV75_008393 [Aspergillus fumigatus]KAH2981634.1 hypothetical protein KXV25_002638 [Aspergillus fumigatus]
MNPTRRQPHPILFVNGPLLGRRGDAKSRNTRSALIRCRISEKRSTYRQEEEEEEESKREQLIAKRQARDRHLADQGESSEAQTTGSRISTRFVPCESHEVPYSILSNGK